jgi:hypothetical protein
MRTHRIADIEDPRIAGYRAVRDADLRGRHDAFIAEGRFILTVLAETPVDLPWRHGV